MHLGENFYFSTIRQIQLNQTPPFAFPIAEPMHTFLMVKKKIFFDKKISETHGIFQELPCWTEKELYTISLQREPRNAEASQIV